MRLAGGVRVAVSLACCTPTMALPETPVGEYNPSLPEGQMPQGPGSGLHLELTAWALGRSLHAPEVQAFRVTLAFPRLRAGGLSQLVGSAEWEGPCGLWRHLAPILGWGDSHSPFSG